MDANRAQDILKTYGAEPARWPADERAALSVLLTENPALRELQREESELDTQLTRSTVQPSLSVAQIMAALPQQESKTGQFFEALIDWLMPGDPILFWRPAFAAALALGVGIWLGGNGYADTDWSSAEQYVFAPYDVEMSYD